MNVQQKRKTKTGSKTAIESSDQDSPDRTMKEKQQKNNLNTTYEKSLSQHSMTFPFCLLLFLIPNLSSF